MSKIEWNQDQLDRIQDVFDNHEERLLALHTLIMQLTGENIQLKKMVDFHEKALHQFGMSIGDLMVRVAQLETDVEHCENPTGL